MSRDRELMRLHVDALFTHDAAGRLVRVNEPGGAPAPRFFLGRTAGGMVRRYRYDIDDASRRALDAASDAADRRTGRAADTPADPEPYAQILARVAPVQRTWAGPAFRFPDDISFPDDMSAAGGCILLTGENAELLRPLLAEWVPDVRHCQPMIALLVDGRAVSLCCSVRRTATAHEAGVETAAASRGRGHAAIVVAEWARAVRRRGGLPLYSTSWQNARSLAVARKLALIRFGSDLHLT
jgi:hypothetical protein